MCAPFTTISYAFNFGVVSVTLRASNAHKNMYKVAPVYDVVCAT